MFLDRQSPVNYNKLVFEEFLFVPVVESVLVHVNTLVGVVLSVVCKEMNYLKIIEYAKETNMFVKLKVADS